MSVPGLEARVVGCMLGGATGDALGAAVEFMNLEDIRVRFGAEGIQDYAEVYGRLGAITDDTQMTLFTAEGLMRAAAKAGQHGDTDPVPMVHRAYLRWLHTQARTSAHPDFDDAIDGWLIRVPGLHSQRAPGNTCLSALMLAEPGACGKPINDSKGCGGLMRVAPAGLVDGDAFQLGCRICALTHGHPSGYLAGGFAAVVVAGLVDGASVREAVDTAIGELHGVLNVEVQDALNAALRASSNAPRTPETVETLGQGWVAEEALAISVYCALVAEDFADGVRLAVNHGGDSDSTGAITGNLLGAAFGEAAIPRGWLEHLELRDENMQLARDLAALREGGVPDPDRYPAR